MNQIHRQAYQAIKEVSQGNRGAITILLKTIGVSRQAYNKSLKRQPTTWELQAAVLEERVKYWFDFHQQAIGAGKLLVNLQYDKQIKFSVSIKQVKRVMRKLNLTCQIRKKKRNRVKRAEQYLQDNVLNQNFDVNAPNQVWLADSTEVTYGLNDEYKMRLSGVLDLYGRQLLAYNLSLTETSAAEIQTFQRAFSVAKGAKPLIHTDRGSAFTSYSFSNYLAQFGVQRSMSRPGTPYDNAPMERWWNEFKLHWLDRHPKPQTLKELVKLIEDGIHYFNHHDRSAARNGLTPVEYRNEAI